MLTIIIIQIMKVIQTNLHLETLKIRINKYV